MFKFLKKLFGIKQPMYDETDHLTPAGLAMIARSSKEDKDRKDTWSQEKLDKWYHTTFLTKALEKSTNGCTCLDMWDIHGNDYNSVSWTQRQNYLIEKGFSIDNCGGSCYVFWN